jgi:hypothetical protein
MTYRRPAARKLKLGLAIISGRAKPERGAASSNVPQPGAAPSPARGRASGRGPVGRDGAMDLRLIET